jgi:hypothetical protein
MNAVTQTRRLSVGVPIAGEVSTPQPDQIFEFAAICTLGIIGLTGCSVSMAIDGVGAFLTRHFNTVRPPQPTNANSSAGLGNVVFMADYIRTHKVRGHGLLGPKGA